MKGVEGMQRVWEVGDGASPLPPSIRAKERELISKSLSMIRLLL